MSTFTLTFLCNFQRTIERIIPYGIGLSKLNRVNIKTQLCLENPKILFYKGYTLCIDSLERRWSSRRFSYGYLVTTSPQSSAPPSAAGSLTGYLTDFGCCRLSWCDGRCVQGPGTYSRQYADLPLLAIPTSCGRVAAHNLNWDYLWGFAPAYALAPCCYSHCSTCVAQDIRGMMIWRRPHLPPICHRQSR